MVGKAWQQDAIPDSYAQQTLNKSTQEIDRVTKALSPPPPLFRQVQQDIQRMTQNIEQHNKAAIATSLQAIAAEQHQLNDLAKAQGVQP